MSPRKVSRHLETFVLALSISCWMLSLSRVSFVGEPFTVMLIRRSSTSGQEENTQR